jgi:hypothetical protein
MEFIFYKYNDKVIFPRKVMQEQLSVIMLTLVNLVSILDQEINRIDMDEVEGIEISLS